MVRTVRIKTSIFSLIFEDWLYFQQEADDQWLCRRTSRFVINKQF